MMLSDVCLFDVYHLSDVCLSDVCHIHPVSRRRVQRAGWMAHIG